MSLQSKKIATFEDFKKRYFPEYYKKEKSNKKNNKVGYGASLAYDILKNIKKKISKISFDEYLKESHAR